MDNNTLVPPVCTLPNCGFCRDLSPEKAVEYFLKESNAIEGIFDEDSLKQSLYAWEYLISEPRLTGGVILKTHKITMLHAKGLRPNERGYWRTSDVRIGYEKIVGVTPDGNGLIKEFVATGEGVEWRHVPSLIKDWLEQTEKRITVVQKFPEQYTRYAAYNSLVGHIEFEHIHPFIDGNGRVGRMLMNWERLKLGLPLLIIHDEDKKDRYYAWFKLNFGTNEWTKMSNELRSRGVI